MTPAPQPLDRIDEVAGEWFARRRSGAMNAADAEALERWLAEDPAHAQAFDIAERMWTDLESIRSNPRIIAIRERGRGVGRRREMYWLPAAMAGAALLAAGTWIAYSAGALREQPAPLRQEFRTSVGQRTTVTLADGSVVTLDTDTVLRTADTRRERRIELEKGRAFFRVAKDRTRPFIVAVGDTWITATGTEFDVRADRRRFEVVLVDGHVNVDRVAVNQDGRVLASRVRELSPGTRLATADGQRWTLSAIDVDREMSWLQGQLTYDGEALTDVVADMNRYSDKKIVIDDPSLSTQKLSGVYKAGDVDEFVRILKVYRIARVSTRSDTTIRIVAQE